MTLHKDDLTVDSMGPDDAGYGGGVRGFYATRRPALVVRPRSVGEVGAVVSHAQRHDLAISVRSGGHSPLTCATGCEEMLIDLVHLGAVDVLDAARRLVRVGGGATWGQVAATLDPYGWAITAGDTAGVGVGGLTLGGGIGWLVRRYGLAIDSLVGARIVTADGRVLTTSEHEHPELFWALRGGGGNFGVVVDFEFVAQPVRTVRFGTVTYRADDAAALIARWRDAMRTASESLSSVLALPPPPAAGSPSATVLLCHAGEPEVTAAAADAAIEPLLMLGDVTSVDIGERRYADILEDATPPPGRRLVVRNTLVDSLADDAIADLLAVQCSAVPTVVALRSLGGAFGRVPGDATAFAHRDAEAMIVALMMFPDTARDDEIDRELRAVARRRRSRHGCLHQLPGHSDANRPGGRLPACHPCAAGRGETHLRSGQPVRDQPQHRAGCEPMTTNPLVVGSMYTGLAMTAVATVAPCVDRATSNSIAAHVRAGYPSYTAAHIDTAANSYLLYLTMVGVLGIVGWASCIRGVIQGRRGVRVASSVMFALGAVVGLTDLLVKDRSGQTALPPGLAWLGVVPSLPGLLAVVLLWRDAAARADLGPTLRAIHYETKEN